MFTLLIILAFVICTGGVFLGQHAANRYAPIKGALRTWICVEFAAGCVGYAIGFLVCPYSPVQMLLGLVALVTLGRNLNAMADDYRTYRRTLWQAPTHPGR